MQKSGSLKKKIQHPYNYLFKINFDNFKSRVIYKSRQGRFRIEKFINSIFVYLKIEKMVLKPI